MSTTLSVTLTFVGAEDDYSIYRASDGAEVYLAHGTRKRLVEFSDLDIHQLWSDHTGYPKYNSRYDFESFREILRGLVIDPEMVDDLDICEDCNDPMGEDDRHWTGNETAVCESCISGYYFCEDCEERYSNTTTTLNDTEVCDRCRDQNWTYCDPCDGYRQDDDYDHDHDHGCDCESPAQHFTVRNDGEDALQNDTRVTVTLPAGIISAEGIGAIAQHLREQVYTLEDEQHRYDLRQLSYRLDELGEKWQTKDGNYTKRLSRFAYKTFGLKLAPEVVSKVGCIARDHSTAIDFAIETTRDLNQSAEEFGHEDSCWWQSYFESRCTFKSNGGFGLRTFTNDDCYTRVKGRAWVMPLRKTEHGDLVPTFDTQTPDAFVVFNGYGDLGGYAAARILSHMAGMTYRKISFTAEPMYINSSAGYLVAAEEIAEGYTDGSLHLSVDQHSNLHRREQRVLANA